MEFDEEPHRADGLDLVQDGWFDDARRGIGRQRALRRCSPRIGYPINKPAFDNMNEGPGAFLGRVRFQESGRNGGFGEDVRSPVRVDIFGQSHGVGVFSAHARLGLDFLFDSRLMC